MEVSNRYMRDKSEFLGKLGALVEVANGQGAQITVDEVKEYFAADQLTEEQMLLVFDYLLAQKVVVKGYVKVEKAETEAIAFTEEEKAYLKEYEEDLKAFAPEKEGERELLFGKFLAGDVNVKERLTAIYLPEIVAIAKEMYRGDVFLGDMIQEGNMGLILGLAAITSVEEAHDVIVAQVKESITMLLEEEGELSSRDKKMVEKVSMLDESIKQLTEDLGRKVMIDELAIFTGLSEEEIEDILRLTGEEPEETEGEE